MDDNDKIRLDGRIQIRRNRQCKSQHLLRAPPVGDDQVAVTSFARGALLVHDNCDR